MTLSKQLKALTNAQTTLSVKRKPQDAQLKIDGVSVPGTLPLSVSVGQEVKVQVSRNGYQTMERLIKIDRTEPRVIHVQLKATEGSIFFESRPPGTVWLNGFRRGRTPVTLRALNVNETWRVQITATGYQPYEKTLSFGGQTSLSVETALKAK
jgi:hypothetical protein